MERPRVCVVDNSPSIRETVAIILGGRCRVTSFTEEQFADSGEHLPIFDLFILGDLQTSAARSRVPAQVPVLHLGSVREAVSSTEAAHAVLGRDFRPEELRAAVETALARRPSLQAPFGARTVIDYPMLPRSATELARRAAQTTLPVLISGESGTGKGRLARAVHTLGPTRTFVTVSARSCNPAALRQAIDLAPGNVTAFINEIVGMDGDGQEALLELLESGGLSTAGGWRSVRVICATAEPLESLPGHPGLDRELLYRLGVLPISIPPLRERAGEIPALAEHVGAQVGSLVLDGPLSFSPSALQRLCNYLWFGNLAEFEAVLLRSAAIRQRRRLEAEDLLFGYAPLAVPDVPASEETAEAPRAEPTPVATNATVDLVIHELAHEFKNPMVTIKTISQGIERLAGDQEGRQQIARLTGDAVERMDRALENLVQYSRFDSPDQQTASLHALLAPSLSDITAMLAEHGVSLDYHPPVSTVVFVDSEQIGYAFDNLLRAVARDLQEGDRLCVRPLEAHPGVALEFPRGRRGVSAKLAEFSANGTANGSPPPLGFVLARSLVERNGGELKAATVDDRVVVTVQLPGRSGEVNETDREGMLE